MMHIMMIEKRRPKICEQYPTTLPPSMAPRLATTWVTVTWLAVKLNWLVSMVG